MALPASIALACLAGLSTAPFPPQETGAEAAAIVLRSFLEQCSDDPARLDALPALLDDLDQALPAAFEVLDDAGRNPAHDDPLFQWLESRGRAKLISTLRERESPEQSRPAVVTLRLIGGVGNANDLKLALVVASAYAPLPERSVRTALTDCVERLLRADPYTFKQLHFEVLERPAEVASCLLRAVSRVESDESIRFTSSLLGFEGELDRLVLAVVGRLAERTATPVDPRITAQVRAYLDEEDAEILAEAVLTVGRMEDFESASRLVELLEDERDGVRENADWALRRMTRLGLDARPEVWRSWFELEQAWFAECAPRLFEDLVHPDLERVARALSEFSVRRLHRDRIALEIERTLEHEDPRARRLACLALARLEARGSIEALRELRDDPDTLTVRAAELALLHLERNQQIEDHPTPSPMPPDKP